MEAEEKVRAMLGTLPDFSCPVLVSGGSRSSRMECAGELCCLIEGKQVPLNSRDILLLPSSPAPAISQVREAVDLMQKFPISLPRRIGIVENISSLSEAGQDALLKDLEEPSKRSSWLLFSPSLLGVAPAIKSRCHSYFLSSSSSREGGEEEKEAAQTLSSLLSLKSMSGALTLASDVAGKAKESEDKKEFCFSFLSSLLFIFSRALKEKDGLPASGEGSSPLLRLSRPVLLLLTEEVKTSFAKVEANVSPQLIFESLFCQILLQWRF
ncbi:MAG: hypothetical protein IIZ04_03970 [Aeriscardovia sp.]|nr:hypothetical protein [Aeriscardovia sp.]